MLQIYVHIELSKIKLDIFHQEDLLPLILQYKPTLRASFPYLFKFH
jgi:hypothetical protein